MYEDHADRLGETKVRVLEAFAEGRRLYEARDFAGAREAFRTALKLDSEDGPSRIFYKRCQLYMANPPAEDWDGVFTMTTK